MKELKDKPYAGDKVELIGFFIEMFKGVHDMLKHRYFQITHEDKVICGCFYVHQLQQLLFVLELITKWRYRYGSNIYNKYNINYVWNIFVSKDIYIYIYVSRIYTYGIRRRYVMYQLILYGLMINYSQA